MYSRTENVSKTSSGENNESSLGLLHLDDMSGSLFFPSFSSTSQEGIRKSEKLSLQSGKRCSDSKVIPLATEYDKFDLNEDEGSLPEIELDQDEKLLMDANFSDFDDLGDENDNEDDSSDNDDDNKVVEKYLAEFKKSIEKAPCDSPSDSEIADIGPRAGRGVGCAVDSSSDVDTEDEIRAVFKQNLKLNKRPGLEGVSPCEEKNKFSSTLSVREGAEGGVVASPSPLPDDGGGGGDGSSGHSSDSDSTPGSHRTQTSTIDVLRGLRFDGLDLERICPQGIEDGANMLQNAKLSQGNLPDRSGLLLQLLQPTHIRFTDSYSIRPWGDESSLNVENLQPRDQSCPGDGSEEVSYPSTIPQQVTQEKIVFSSEQMSARSSSLPSSRNNDTVPIDVVNDTFDSQGISNSKVDSNQKPLENFGKDFSNILAFKTNLRNEYGQGDNLTCGDMFGVNDDDFISDAQGLEMLEMDEKKFEEKNKFAQIENAKSWSLSSSWAVQGDFDVSRPSWMTDDDNQSRISIGKFLRSKTNPLGTLGGNKEGIERPHFGGEELRSPRSSMGLPLITDESIENRMSRIEDPKNKSCAESTSVLSISTISKIIADASVSADPKAMADMIMKVSKQNKRMKERTSQIIENSTFVTTPKDNPKADGTTEKDRLDSGDLLLNWEPVRPSLIAPRQSETTPIVFSARSKPLTNVRFDSTCVSAKKTDDINTPSNLIPQLASRFPTSTPFIGQTMFPLDFNGSSNWPSVLTNEPTPKMRSYRAEPRTILTSPGSKSSVKNKTVEGNDDKISVDTTLTEDFISPPRLSGGQDTVVPFKDSEKKTEKLTVSLSTSSKQPVSSSLPHASVVTNSFIRRTASILPSIMEKSNESFHPLTHNTIIDEDQTVTSTSNDDTLTNDYKLTVKLPFPAKSEKQYARTSSESTCRQQTSQLKDCATVSLQRSMAVRVPSELNFGDVACVGLAVESHLPVQNLTSRWLKCNFQLVSLTVDGQSLPTEISPFIFKQETIVEPNSSDQVKILYASRVPGAIVAQLQVTSQPMVPNKTGQSDSNLSYVTLIAEAEHPNIQVLHDGKTVIDFGTIPEDSCTELSLGLVNVGPATVPIRLVIHGSSKAWQGFYFPKKNLDSKSPPARSLLSPTIISFKMNGQSNGSNALQVFNTQIAFRAPNIESHARNSIVSLTGTLNIEIDCPSSTPTILHTFPVVARVGTVHLETLKNIEPLKLFSVAGSSAIAKVPLRNSGSIPIVLEATISHCPRLFVINPHSLHIPPGQESEISITFVPQTQDDRIVSVLLLTIFPGGPAYEIQMIAETISVPQNIHLESNKHLLTWASVPLSKFEDQTLTLRNSSPSNDASRFQVSIRGATEDFWLVVKDSKVHSFNFELEPNKEYPLVIRFSPISAKHSAAKVVIKPAGGASIKPIRYVIPLVGYGGSSNLELIGLAQNSKGIYQAHVGPNTNSNKVYTLLIKNIGDWAAFVTVLVSADKDDNSPNASSGWKSAEILVTPNEFVIGSKKTVKILVAIRSNTDSTSHNDPCIGNLTILYGDEVSRRRFRKAITKENGTKDAKNQPSVNFDVAYKGEQYTDEDDLPSTPNDIQLFYNGVKHCQIHLLTDVQRRNNATEQKQIEEPLRVSLPNDLREISPSVTASPPVREIRKESEHNENVSRWEVIPKKLSFAVNKLSPSSYLTQIFRLINKCSSNLKFDFMWPGHMLSLNPANGIIEPMSQINITVTAIPSDAHDWEGTIFLICDNKQQEIKVTISENSNSQRNGRDARENAASPIKIKPKEITFNPTLVGKSSEFVMGIANTNSKSQQWILSSLAPAVISCKNTNVDVRKVNYSVFRFTQLSGQLKPDEQTEIPVTFLPLENGKFTQKWELVTKDVNKTLHNVTVTLIGEGVSQTGPSNSMMTNDFRKPSDINMKRSVRRSSRTSTSSVQSTKSTSSIQSPRTPIQLSTDCLTFPSTTCSKAVCEKLKFDNVSQEDHKCRVLSPKPPFYVHHPELNILRRRFIRLPVYFKPTQLGVYKETLHIETDYGHKLHVILSGSAVDKDEKLD